MFKVCQQMVLLTIRQYEAKSGRLAASVLQYVTQTRQRSKNLDAVKLAAYFAPARLALSCG